MNEQSPLAGAVAVGEAAGALRRKLRGQVLLPGEPGYEGARSLWNAMIDRRPAVILRCRGVADVIDAVKLAAALRLPLAIRAGAHNVAGLAIADDAVMVDLSLMRGVRVDPQARVAQVEGGATWGDVDRETQAFGLATPGGLISDTGVAGLTLAGGIGWLRSRHGLCIDNLLAADVVTADGRLVHANAEQNADLFWALRGGGGNFGVVVRFEFRLHPIAPRLAFAAPIYPLTAGSSPIRFWRDFLADKHGDVASLVEFSTIPEGPDFPQADWGKRVYTVAAVHAGDPDEGERLLRPLREQGELVADLSAQLPYCELQKLFDGVAPAGTRRAYWKSHFLSTLPDALIEQGLAAAAENPSEHSLSSFWNFGGATARVPADATALGDRSMGWMYSIDTMWTDPADDARNIAWTRRQWDATRRWSQDGRLYLNFLGAGEADDRVVRDSYGKTFQRLAAIKAKYDPGNLFRINHNIRPAA
jgi:FAD/FMN-containing dehydrogenase